MMKAKREVNYALLPLHLISDFLDEDPFLQYMDYAVRYRESNLRERFLVVLLTHFCHIAYNDDYVSWIYEVGRIYMEGRKEEEGIEDHLNLSIRDYLNWKAGFGEASEVTYHLLKALDLNSNKRKEDVECQE